MNKEYEAIAAKFAGEIYDATSVENAHGIVRSAVEACYALANKPVRELTEMELHKVHTNWCNGDVSNVTALLRMVETAAHKKQREPQTVKFRAARNKVSGQVELFKLGTQTPPQDYGWEWLDADGKPQIYEVVLP